MKPITEEGSGFYLAIEDEDLMAIETMARIIVPEVYGAYVELENCEQFIHRFQTVAALKEQIQSGYEYFLIYSNGICQGYFALVYQPDRVLLSKLYLLSEARGKGMGQMAMDFSISEAKKRGYKRIDLIVNRQNEGAIGFYQRNGFSIVESLEHDFGKGYLVYDYRMKKELDK
ncbi:MAG: GNAT family N-acetyltransferase [Bacteroidia bacterium]|nr:GNAT family N-acetyltransferase [Bacteroidia bacterium]